MESLPLGLLFLLIVLLAFTVIMVMRTQMAINEAQSRLNKAQADVQAAHGRWLQALDESVHLLNEGYRRLRGLPEEGK